MHFYTCPDVKLSNHMSKLFKFGLSFCWLIYKLRLLQSNNVVHNLLNHTTPFLVDFRLSQLHLGCITWVSHHFLEDIEPRNCSRITIFGYMWGNFYIATCNVLFLSITVQIDRLILDSCFSLVKFDMHASFNWIGLRLKILIHVPCVNSNSYQN